MIWDLVGFLGIILTATQLLPQIIKAIKTKHTKDVSVGLGLIVAVNAVTWIAYGLHIHDFAVVTSNIFNLICAITLLTIKFKTDRYSPIIEPTT